MYQLFGLSNEPLSLPWYTDFTKGLEKFRNLSQVISAVVLLFENIIHDGWRYISAETKHLNSQRYNIPSTKRNRTVLL